MCAGCWVLGAGRGEGGAGCGVEGGGSGKGVAGRRECWEVGEGVLGAGCWVLGVLGGLPVGVSQ